MQRRCINALNYHSNEIEQSKCSRGSASSQMSSAVKSHSVLSASALDQTEKKDRRRRSTTGQPPTTEVFTARPTSRLVPCVDGSQLAREILTSRCWSVPPCVRPVDAVHMTAGHKALRGSGPGQLPAFDDTMALVGCPDRRIDRLCITCCSPSQLSHAPGGRRDLVHAASATGSL